ncbi:MAG: hypothetical protein IJV77_06660 [Clostridia bacterium]|nr:hypothetical protein [Clostridia bacterium]
MTAKIVIKNDVFDIAQRIKEIDNDYFVVYDKKLCRFEVHNKRQKPDTLCLVLPYDTLDCRAIEKVLSTRVQYIANKLDEIDKHNEKLQKDSQRQMVQQRLEECHEILRRPSG